jgi:hypothetical protein
MIPLRFWLPRSVAGFVIAVALGSAIAAAAYTVLGGESSRLAFGLSLMMAIAGGSLAGTLLERPLLQRSAERDLRALSVIPGLEMFLVALSRLDDEQLAEVSSLALGDRTETERAWASAFRAARESDTTREFLMAEGQAATICAGGGFAQEAAGRAAAAFVIRDSDRTGFDVLYRPFRPVIPLASLGLEAP